MRKVAFVAILMLTAWLALPSLAQHQFMRGNCMPDSETADGGGPTVRKVMRHLRTPNTEWDAERTYPVAVVLVEACDTTFTIEEPHEFYNLLFNERGFNQRNGQGCVADYFRTQSHGLFNLVFDIYGPVKVSQSMRSNNKYGGSSFKEAMQQVVDANPHVDFTQYDWDGNGAVEQVVFVYAGFGGNESNAKATGCIWPNTGSFGTITTPSGVSIKNYTASAEMWAGNSQSCGIGTICHEFTHCLGLPDIYPTSGSVYSVLDEWDLMDGGNFTNYGWCPPNFTPTEKMLLGWLEPEELTEPASITDMKPVSEGGTVYKISHTASEYYLLENRQQRGWDFGVPGKGLVIYHVDYDKSAWNNNRVNGTNDLMRFQLVAADNLDFAASRNWVIETYGRQYLNGQRLNSFILSNAAFPWIEDSVGVKNCEVTDSSVPSAKMNQKNAAGSKLLSKPITNIRMSEDGLISFDFMGGVYDGISSVTTRRRAAADKVYNLQGQQVAVPRKGIYIVDGKKVIIR